MPSNSAASSLARSVDNTVAAVLLTVALALLFFMVVGLLVFSLVELMGSAVVHFAVLGSYFPLCSVIVHCLIFG